MHPLFLRVLVALLLITSPTVFAAPAKAPAASILPQAPQYVCPMHSHIVRDHEGTCPICGMDLVARAPKAPSAEVKVAGNMQQAFALVTETVSRSDLWRYSQTYGSVQFDETGLNHLHPRAAGWLETLSVNSLGQGVEKGELLYEIYAPDLLVAQEDFLSLLATGRGDPSLLERGRQRLRLLGFRDQLIRQLEQTKQVFYRVPYYADGDSIVSRLDAREGMYVEPENEMMTLADLSSVWVVADISEAQAAWFKQGTYIDIDVPALNLTGLEGQVEFVYPTMDPITRTLKVRLSLDNPGQRLKPDMLATVKVYGGKLANVINIPVAALIQTGQSNRVIVQTGDELFEPRDVRVGTIAQSRAQILSGLEVGERVVVSGQFLLDAEASLSNVTATGIGDTPSRGASGNPHQHH